MALSRRPSPKKGMGSTARAGSYFASRTWSSLYTVSSEVKASCKLVLDHETSVASSR